MDLQKLLTRLETFEELTDTSAVGDMSPTYFEIDGDVFKAALAELQAYEALRDRMEESSINMADLPEWRLHTGQFIAAHLRELLKE